MKNVEETMCLTSVTGALITAILKYCRGNICVDAELQTSDTVLTGGSQIDDTYLQCVTFGHSGLIKALT